MGNFELKCPEYGIVIKEHHDSLGSYYAMILPEYDRPVIDIPEEVNQKRIAALECYKLHSSVRKIRLSRAVEKVRFIGREMRGRFLELEIDKENPHIFTDGKAVFTKNGELTLFFAGGCTSYEIPAGTRVIKNDAFGFSPNIRHIRLPQGVETIEAFAFCDITALRDINIPEGVRTLEKSVFSGCKNLETLHIPSSVEEIGIYAFPNTGAFREITVDADNPYYTAENGVLYSKDKTRLIFAPPKAAGKRFAVPDFVKTIGGSAFEGSPDLEEVILPPSVSVIEQRAFYGCQKLCSINLENVKLIDSYAFESCSRLIGVELFCEELGEYVFRSCHRMRTAEVNGLKKCGCNPFDDNLHELILLDYIDPVAFRNLLGDHRKSPDVITVRDHETREMLYKVSGVAENIFDLNNISNNFHGSDFDFESYDRYFEERFGGKDLIFDITKIYTAFLRLKYPRRLSESARELYLNVLSEEAEYALALAIRTKKIEALPECFEVGMINEGNIIALINYTVEANAPEFTALLLELKNKYFPDMTDSLNLE